MSLHITDVAARLIRLRANRLDRAVGRTGVAAVTDVVRGICGVQAQSWPAAALAIRARTPASTRADVDAALVEQRSIVRGWFMRGTLHALPAEDVGWILRLLGPSMIAATGRRYRELGLSEATRERASEIIERALRSDGPLTRREIGERLVNDGLPITTAGQHVFHLIRMAGLEGRLCYGPERDGVETWVAMTDWLDATPDPTFADPGALGELARRYLRGYGPATPADFAKWSGLALPTARAAFHEIGQDLAEVRVDGELASALGELHAPPAATGEVRLLGEFDPYLLGYRSRSLIVDDRFAHAIHPGGGVLRPTIIRDGWAVGTWRLDRAQHPPAVTVDPFDPDDPPNVSGETEDLRRFLVG